MRLSLLAGAACFIGMITVPVTGFAKYTRLPMPIASAVLLTNGQTHAVAILNATNVEIHLQHADYQDMDITKAFDVECLLPGNNQQLVVSARVDSRYHMIPIDVIEYKEFNPGYIKLGIDTIFLRNADSSSDYGDHKIYIDFFAADPRL